jgi:hypothetical protein
MPNTYTLLETITVGAAGASSVTFNSIPQTGYTDLVLKVSGRINSTNPGWYDANITFNGVGTSYSGRYLYGNGSATVSGSESSITIRCSSNAATASTFGNAEVYIPNYTSANYKSVSIDQVGENNATLGLDMITASLWSNTAAISSMTLTPITSTTWMQYSTFTLYGISNA